MVAKMKYGKVPGVRKAVSRIVLGTMIVNVDEEERSRELLDAAFELGINTFDTAHVYAGGNSERCLGPWISDRGIREKVVIIGKGCHHNADRNRVTPFDIAADLHDSLARLRMDYIDIYMLHRDDPSVPVGPIVEALNEQMHAGRIRAFGGSNWDHTRIAQANDYATANHLTPFTVSSPNFGLAEQVENPWGPGCVTLSGARNEAARRWYRHNGIGIFAYSSLGRGLFSGRITRENYTEIADGACRKAYCHDVNFQRLDRATEMAREKGVTLPQIALAYVLNQGLDMFALVGAASREECGANMEALNIKLNRKELKWLESGSE